MPIAPYVYLLYYVRMLSFDISLATLDYASTTRTCTHPYLQLCGIVPMVFSPPIPLDIIIVFSHDGLEDGKRKLWLMFPLIHGLGI